MGMSPNLKFKPGIVALVAVGVVQLATALPQIQRLSSLGAEYGGDHLLYVRGSENCETVVTALNSLKYGSSPITGFGCNVGDLYVSGSENCETVVTALNSLKYGSSSITGVGCRFFEAVYRLYTNEPKDVELLNTLLALSVKGYSAIDVDMHSQIADLKALLTPECTANRLARAQGNSATDPANSSDRKTNIAAIVVPIVAVLLVAAIAATVLVMKGRGADAYAEVERRAANVPPATTQPNPAFTPADAADAVPEPGSDEDIDL